MFGLTITLVVGLGLAVVYAAVQAGNASREAVRIPVRIRSRRTNRTQ